VCVLQNQTMINTPDRATVDPTTAFIETCSPLSIPIPRANRGEVARRVWDISGRVYSNDNY